MKNRTLQILLIGSSFFSISATSAVHAVKTHNIHFVGNNCTINGESEFNDTVISGKTDLKYTIQAADNYLMPTKNDIDCGGVDFEYSGGIISFPDPINQDIEITATCTETYQKEYDFTFNGTGCTINGETNYNSKIPYLKEDVKFTIVPTAGKKISSITVTKGKDIVDVDETNNIITISSMTEDVEISASTIGKNQIGFKGVDCIATGHDQDGGMFSLTGIVGSSYTFILTPDNEYVLPDDVKVKVGDRVGVIDDDYQYEPNGDGTYQLSFTLEDTTSIQVVATLPITTTYSVDFNSNGGSTVASITDIEPGAIITEPTNPTKQGYTFDGWFLDNGTFQNKFNFIKNHISSDLTLYAKWIDAVNTVTVTLDAGKPGFIETTQQQRYYSFNVQKGTTWGSLPERLIGAAAPMCDFLYWTVNGNKITDSMIINDNIELEAVYLPTSNEYLTFIPRNDTATLIVNEGDKDLSYKTSFNDTWVDVTDDTKNITVSRGDRIFIKGKNNSVSNNVFSSESMSYFAVSGKCSSIYASLSMSNYIFYRLFLNFYNLKSAYNLLLPATTLANYCYEYMFDGCASLTQAPALPATTLANYCYCYMFYGCTSLTQAPTLPATTLADYCYNSMFDGCASLTQAPTLPATALADHCYSYMFYGCASLNVSEKSGEKLIFTCPPTEGIKNPVSDMFAKTGGSFDGTPTAGNKYYYN